MPALMAIGAFWRHQSWCFVLEVFKDQLNHLGIFDAGNDFDQATAVFTDLDIDVQDAFGSLHLGHGSLAVCGTLVTPAGIGYFSFVWLLATLSRRHLSAMLAVGRKDSVEAGETADLIMMG